MVIATQGCKDCNRPLGYMMMIIAVVSHIKGAQPLLDLPVSAMGVDPLEELRTVISRPRR
jgi:hypothetical protein